MTNTSGWATFLRYIRTPLGAVIALDVLVLMGFIPVSLAQVSLLIIAYTAFFMFMTLGGFIFIVVRTPKSPHGLVASEDYYALQSYFRSNRVYGDNTTLRTRQATVEDPNRASADTRALPPPLPTALEERDE